MANVRVQYRRQLAGAPTIGKWDVYSGAYFNTATPTPSPTVLTLLQKMFLGYATLGESGNNYTDTRVFETAAGAARIDVWTVAGGALTAVASEPVTVPTAYPPTPHTGLPSQCQLTFGYKADVGGNPQRGRSRFWIGPLSINVGQHLNNFEGGLHLKPETADRVLSNSLGAINDLAAEGWELRVKSGTGGGTSFAAPSHFYVDDVFDIMKSRRSWQLYQAREDL